MNARRLLDLLETPDNNHLGQSWSTASYVFGFIGEACVVADANRGAATHRGLLSALKNIAEGITVPGNEIKVFGGDIQTIGSQVPDGYMSPAFVRKTMNPAGRVWGPHNRHPGVVSWWADQGEVSNEDETDVRNALKQAFGVDVSPYDQEFLDRVARPSQSDNVSSADVALLNQLYGELSPPDKAAALAKAHVSPQSLTPSERGVVQKFRGTPKPKPRSDMRARYAAHLGDSESMNARALLDILCEGRSGRPYDAMKTFKGGPSGFDDAAYEKSMQAFRSQSPHVPRTYRLDHESNCLGNSENLADMNPKLELVSGYCKRPTDKQWGSHQWCVARDGTIVDPFFEWRFGPDHQKFEYRPAAEGEEPFD